MSEIEKVFGGKKIEIKSTEDLEKIKFDKIINTINYIGDTLKNISEKKGKPFDFNMIYNYLNIAEVKKDLKVSNDFVEMFKDITF